MLKKFRTVRLNEVDESLFQDNVSDYLSQLDNKPQLDSVIIPNINLSTNPLAISHGLGRTWVGWQLINQNTNTVVWSPSSAVNNNLFLTLEAGASCTVSILVF